MIVVPPAFSTAAPWTLRVTSHIPNIAPATNSTAPKTTASVTNVSTGITTQVTTADVVHTARDPNRRFSRPPNGIEQNDPSPKQRRTIPIVRRSASRWSRTAGMRENQDPAKTPLRVKQAKVVTTSRRTAGALPMPAAGISGPGS